MLAAFGVLVIGLVDNLLRPVLVGKDTRLPDYVVLITTLGGMAAIGINGFVLGPVIAAMFVALWHLQGRTRASVRQIPPTARPWPTAWDARRGRRVFSTSPATA